MRIVDWLGRLRYSLSAIVTRLHDSGQDFVRRWTRKPTLPPPVEPDPLPAHVGPPATPHIVGEIDLGMFGKVIKREDDKWFERPKPKRAPPSADAPKRTRKVKLLAGVAPIAPPAPPSIADIGAQIAVPSTKQELAAALDLLEQTPEFTSGRYVVHAPEGGYTPETYDKRLFPHNDDAGIFYFRGHLLDALDVYFAIMHRLRGADPDAYALHAKVGCTLEPDMTLLSLHRLPPIWKDIKHRPAFGCACFCRAEREDNNDLMLHMQYFEKLEKTPSHVEPTEGGTLYEVTTYFDDLKKHKKQPRWWRKHGAVFSYFVNVDETNNVTLLKTLQSKHFKSDKRVGEPLGLTNKGHPKTRVRRVTDYIPYKEWGMSDFLLDWYKDCRVRNKKEGRPWDWDIKSIDNWVHSTFCALVNAAATVEYGVRVNITNKHGEVAALAVDPRRCSYFFQDRGDTSINASGKRGRIFHVVKPHERVLPNGNTITIGMHFRGMRKFGWGPYSVHITMPGLHHMPITEFTPGVTYKENQPELEDMIYVAEIGGALAKHIDGMSLRKALRAVTEHKK